MNIAKQRRKSFRMPWLGIALALGAWFGYDHLLGQWQEPQATLVLGGEPSREQFAADFARQHPSLPVWVSGGSNPEYADWVFSQAGIDPERIHLDYEAVDTVTNFTTVVDKLKAQGVERIYLITSDYHMRRATIIGQIVLGSRGIKFKPVAIPSNEAPEPLDKALRDGARSVLWVATGSTGSSFKEKLNSHGIRLPSEALSRP